MIIEIKMMKNLDFSKHIPQTNKSVPFLIAKKFVKLLLLVACTVLALFPLSDFLQEVLSVSSTLT